MWGNNIKKKEEKKVITYEELKKEHLTEARMLCLVPGTFGALLSLLSFLGFYFLAFDFLPTSVKSGTTALVVLAVIGALSCLGFMIYCLFPLIYGIYKIYTVLNNYRIVEGEIEYIKPYEKEYKEHRRHYTKIHYFHGIYFKEHGKFMTESNPDTYHAGDIYYLEIYGKKKPKIIMIHNAQKCIFKG